MKISIDESTIEKLEHFRNARKFGEIEKFHPAFNRMMTVYIGAPDEDTRMECEQTINDLVDSLINELPNSPLKKTVLEAFETHLANFEMHDTEERTGWGLLRGNNGHTRH